MEEITKITVEEAVEKILTPLPYNKHDIYISTEFQVIDYQRSWKKCHCGRQTWMNDNYCPSCGQKLGMPNIYDD